MSLPENLRQEYLQAMGIASYFPRLNLPGAPRSSACAWPDAWRQPVEKAPDSRPVGTDAVSVTETAMPAAPAETVSTPPLGKTVTAPDSRPARAAGKPVADAVESRELPAEEARFQMIFACAGEDLGIINLVPHISQRRLSPAHVQLLGRLVHALGKAQDSLEIEQTPFRWPAIEGMQVDNGKPAARAALMAFLQQKHDTRPFRYLLVLGEMALNALMDEDDGTFFNDAPWRTVQTRSLDEILSRPVLKQEVWASLRPLSGLKPGKV